MTDSGKESQVKVVDRRWWARAEDPGDPAQDDASLRKPTVVEDLERRLADTTEQLQAVLAEHRRATDEFEQVKVRIRREVGREVERGRRAVLAEWLEVVDNLDRAIAAAQSAPAAESSATLLRGVELVRDQFLAKLAAFGVVRMAALGAAFDPSRHEAVSTAPVDPAQDGLVVAVAREGYMVADEVLRPAAVVVGAAHG